MSSFHLNWVRYDWSQPRRTGSLHSARRDPVCALSSDETRSSERRSDEVRWDEWNTILSVQLCLQHVECGFVFVRCIDASTQVRQVTPFPQETHSISTNSPHVVQEIHNKSNQWRLNSDILAKMGCRLTLCLWSINTKTLSFVTT